MRCSYSIAIPNDQLVYWVLKEDFICTIWLDPNNGNM